MNKTLDLPIQYLDYLTCFYFILQKTDRKTSAVMRKAMKAVNQK